MEISTIGVIGAGQMGNGIAQVCATAGYRVVMNDVSPDALDRGLKQISSGLMRMVQKEQAGHTDVESTLERIVPSTDIQSLSNVDLVIEAATEKLELKETIFRSLKDVVPDHALMATNTSSISITRLAAVTNHPEKFIGLHFMNPVPRMKLIEVIRGLSTDDQTYETAITLAGRLGKSVTNSEDYPAFIVNRVLIPMINEAVYALYEGVGNVESIDRAMKLGANHPMGPLQLGDFIGLDTCLSIMQVLHDGLADTKYRPCPLLVKYVEAGWLGRKSGKGFYDYSDGQPIATR